MTALLMQNLNLLGGALKQGLEEHLLVHLFLNRRIDLLLGIGHVARLFGPDSLAELEEELLPGPQSPRVKLTDGSDPAHSLLTGEARVPEDLFLVHLNHCPN